MELQIKTLGCVIDLFQRDGEILPKKRCVDRRTILTEEQKMAITGFVDDE